MNIPDRFISVEGANLEMGAGQNTILETMGLCKHYTVPSGVVKAVDDMNLGIDSGEFMALMGPSGSGKSTFLSMLGGLVRPTKGQVLLEGVDIWSISNRQVTEIRRSKLGFVFQAYYLLEHMTAMENVLFPLQFSSLPQREWRPRAEELLEMVGLQDRLDHFPSQLSGGEKQRVAIARALANEPALLLADEPTGNLDQEATHNVLGIFQQLNQDLGQTIVAVTHDDAAASYASRVLSMEGGRLVAAAAAAQ